MDYQPFATNESNDPAGFLLRLDENGELVWATTTLSSPYSWLSGLTATQSGNLVATGDFHGFLELGDSTLTASSKDGDLWVAEFDTDGENVWSFSAGPTERADGADVVAQPDALVLVGSLAGTGDWGTGAVTSAGLTDMIVSRRPLP